MTRTPMLRRALTVAGATALALGLASCAAPDYEPAAAERLQESVLVATNAAASGDEAAVLSTLAALEVELRDALARGQITQARFDAVSAAIALVREDADAVLAAELAAQQAALDAIAEQQQPTAPDTRQGEEEERDEPENNRGPGNKGPGENKGPGDNGPGNGKGKGYGNGKGPGKDD